MEPDRRATLLALLATALPLSGCITARAPLCPKHPAISDPGAALTIDVHAHVFNGADLQIQEFLGRVVYGQPDSELYPLVNALGGMLQSLAWHAAPSAREEMRMLDAYDKQMKQCENPDGLRFAAAEAFDDGYRRGRDALLAAEERAKTLTRPPGTLGPQEWLPALDLSQAVRRLPPTFDQFEKQSRPVSPAILATQPDPWGYIKFVLHHFNYRHVNVFDYLRSYSYESKRKIDLLVACMVDYDWWLAGGKGTPTSLEEQVNLMSRICVLTGGRVHGFAPFCPFREAMTRGSEPEGDSLRLVKRAVEREGFLGVKLYPPMGFAPWGNAPLQVWRGKNWLPAAAMTPDFGSRLDESMQALFRWCLERDVPVMAHTNHSNGPSDDFKKLAGSEYWSKALTQFPGLRVNFGHFGDTDPEDHAGERSRAFIRLMGTSDGARAFADTSYFAGVLIDRDRVAEVMQALYAGSPDKVLIQRLMYGTDWTMILTQRNVDRYLQDFIEVASSLEQRNPGAVRGTSLAEAFFGANAVAFLGLESGKPARKRLEAFYSRNRVAEPDWMRKLGSA